MNFDDINFRQRPYDPMVAYAQAKTANVLFAVEADRRWNGDGITVNAAHPGAVLSNLTRHMSEEALDRAKASEGEFKTPEQGAATSVCWRPGRRSTVWAAGTSRTATKRLGTSRGRTAWRTTPLIPARPRGCGRYPST